MDQIAISVIIPVYNVERYLRDCLDSVINQSFQDIEIICVNDGSTDASEEILKEYTTRDSRLIVLDYHANRGQAYARNRGMEIARGKYVYFVDSDDVVKEDALQFLYHQAEQDEVDGILFGAESITEEGYEKYLRIIKRKSCLDRLYKGIELVPNLIRHDEYYHFVWGQFWKRAYLEMNSLNFREDTAPHEDILFSIQAIFLAQKIRCVPDSLYIYRKRKGATTTAKMNKKRAMAIMLCYIEAMNFLEKRINELSFENLKIIGNYFSHLRSSIWKNYHELSCRGFDIDTIGFNNKRYEFYFQSYILGRYAFIPDYIPFKVQKKIQGAKYIIVYGAGHVGKEVIEQLMSYGFAKFLVAVSKKESNNASIMGRTIFAIDELKKYKDEAIVLVSAIKRHQGGMIQCLKENGFSNYVCMV